MHELVIRGLIYINARHRRSAWPFLMSGREAVERIYNVSFFKRLVDTNGRPVDACQGAVEVRAADHDSAIEHARKRFADLKNVLDWSLRADYEKVELLEARKRLSIRMRPSKARKALAKHSGIRLA
jgi:hypothetical protein